MGREGQTRSHATGGWVRPAHLRKAVAVPVARKNQGRGGVGAANPVGSDRGRARTCGLEPMAKLANVPAVASAAPPGRRDTPAPPGRSEMASMV